MDLASTITLDPFREGFNRSSLSLLPKYDVGWRATTLRFCLEQLVLNQSRRRPLVIDPVLSFATYLGGSLGEASGKITVEMQHRSKSYLR